MKTRIKDNKLVGIFYLLLGAALYSLPVKAADTTEVSYRTVTIEGVISSTVKPATPSVQHCSCCTAFQPLHICFAS